MPLINQTVGFIGAGNMAEALIKSMIQGGLIEPSSILASDININRGRELEKTYKIQFFEDNKKLVKQADFVVYAVKPYMLEQILSEVFDSVRPQQVHISVAAGISLDFIENNLPPDTPVIRVMPNTPCLVGAGASAYSIGKAAGPAQEEAVKQMLDCTGVSVKVEEHLLNAVTGLSGSGPAYVFLIIEALADAGVKAGLPRDVAVTLAAQTLFGSAKMVLDSKEHPAKLKDMVTTPAGTTIAGLHVLEKGALRGVLMDAVSAAVERAGELGSGRK